MTRLIKLISLLYLSAIPLAVAAQEETLFRLLNSGETGIRFINNINESENLNVLAYEYFYNGGGAALGDINNDGLDDIFFTANMGPNKLYLNLGGLKFKDITREAGIGLEGKQGGWKTGATMADVNGDGLLDIYVCYSGKVNDDLRRNELFINRSISPSPSGEGRSEVKFVEKAKEYGLDDKSYSTQAAFFDYDNDGDLDMFLLNHSTKKIDNMELARYRNDVDELAGNKLYENTGNHFKDVSFGAGIRQNPLTFGLGIAIADINKDGWQDVYVTNDYNEPDYLYINNGNKTFREESKHCFNHLSQFSMGVDIADFNNDGLPDIMTLDMLPEDNRRQKLLQLQENYESFELMTRQRLHKQYMRNMLQLNNGDGTFSEIAQLAGVSNTDWSWCPLFADFDNDGYKDLFVTNGYLRDYTNKDFLRYWGDYKIKKAIDRQPLLLMDLIKSMPVTTLPNYIYRNNHNLTFSNMQKAWGFEKTKISSAAAYADLDNDGDLDLVINNINENAYIYKNTSREKFSTSYLSVKLNFKKENANATGAKVYLYSGGSMQYQEVNPNRGYLSCVSSTLLFGLGNQKKVDSLIIIWPDNNKQVLKEITANQKLVITYNDAVKNIQQVDPVKPEPLFSKVNALPGYTHTATGENDFKRQLLMLFMYSGTGPVLAKADVNKDGSEDLFVGGDKNKAANIYLQQAGGKFLQGATISSEGNDNSNVAAAVFFDADNDGDDDLYLARGGYALYEANTAALQDELWLNDGKGNFIHAKENLPDVSGSSKSCVRPCDYDGDGDMDLFIGGRIIPGKYPVAPKTYLLNNDGKGIFSIFETPFSESGMVTDAQWTDLNDDGRKDLVVCGEFMPLKIFINTPNGFTDKTSDFFEKPNTGFWFTLTVADVNGDGKEDIIAGNLGLNSQIKISEKEPGELFYADFDNNGSIDPFFNFYVQGTSYPFVSRDELNDQIYPMRRKFSSYRDYSTATINNIFTKEELSNAGKLNVTEIRTLCFINRGGKFTEAALPLQAQFSPVTKILADDFNHDGNMDLLLAGNRSDNRLKIGSIDANFGCILTGDGKGNFNYVNQPASGLSLTGDVKSALQININSEKYFVVGINDQLLQFYKYQ
ncbi:MAG: VCBS repeat-containing protein [Chitinophagaceae bacterium]|nr:VCBS repeat-containing protein [Chitinophagaceae bacterium]